MATHEQRAPQPIEVVRTQLTQMEPEFAKALPSHIPAQRFIRVVMTALQSDPKLQLINADRKSLFRACVQCAQDGLLPDGREAALVPYRLNDDEESLQGLFVQYIPMISGIRKKVRQSGELASWEARIARENDEFEVFFGDDERIHHKPNLLDPGKIIAVYSIAVFKDGFKSRDVMTIAEVEGIRKKSRARRGPWNDPVFYPEMVKKTMLRRHSKALPLSAELDLLLRRDDVLYDLEGKSQAEDEALAPGRHKRPTLHDFSASGQQQIEHVSASQQSAEEEAQGGGSQDGEERSAAWNAGYDAFLDGKPLSSLPQTFRGKKSAAEYRAGYEAAREAQDAQ